jgi:hypothetical protein
MIRAPFKCISSLLATGIIAIAISGCAPVLVDLVDKGVVSIERLPSRNIYVPGIHVYEDGGELVISGRVRRLRSTRLGGGYVDIVVISPDGKIIEYVRTRYYPRIIPREGKRESRFTVRLPFIPPKGSIIKVGQID